MKITSSGREKLVITDFPYWIGLLTFIPAAYLAYHTCMSYRTGVMNHRDLLGAGLGIALFFMAGVVFTKRTVFTFDVVRRQIRWSRNGLFMHTTGAMPFDQVTGCVVETSGSGGGQSYRVTLLTLEGMVPLTSTFKGGHEASFKIIRNAIVQAVGLPITTETQSDEADLRALVASGAKIEAIQLVRARRGGSIADAKKVVDELGK